MQGAIDLESGAGIKNDQRADRHSGDPTRAADAEECVDWPDELKKNARRGSLLNHLEKVF